MATLYIVNMILNHLRINGIYLNMPDKFRLSLHELIGPHIEWRFKLRVTTAPEKFVEDWLPGIVALFDQCCLPTNEPFIRDLKQTLVFMVTCFVDPVVPSVAMAPVGAAAAASSPAAEDSSAAAGAGSPASKRDRGSVSPGAEPSPKAPRSG